MSQEWPGRRAFGAPWWRGAAGLTEEAEDEVQLFLDRGAREEGPPCGHLVVNAAHTPATGSAAASDGGSAGLLQRGLSSWARRLGLTFCTP